MGKSSRDASSSCTMKFLVLLIVFSVISWSSMSSALAMSDVEGIFSSALFSAMAVEVLVP